MKCPNCGGELCCPDYAWHEVNNNRSPATVRSECCGKAVRLIPRDSFDVFSTRGIEFDDWGNKCNTSSS